MSNSSDLVAKRGSGKKIYFFRLNEKMYEMLITHLEYYVGANRLFPSKKEIIKIKRYNVNVRQNQTNQGVMYTFNSDWPENKNFYYTLLGKQILNSDKKFIDDIVKLNQYKLKLSGEVHLNIFFYHDFVIKIGWLRINNIKSGQIIDIEYKGISPRMKAKFLFQQLIKNIFKDVKRHLQRTILLKESKKKGKTKSTIDYKAPMLYSPQYVPSVFGLKSKYDALSEKGMRVQEEYIALNYILLMRAAMESKLNSKFNK